MTGFESKQSRQKNGCYNITVILNPVEEEYRWIQDNYLVLSQITPLPLRLYQMTSSSLKTNHNPSDSHDISVETKYPP